MRLAIDHRRRSHLLREPRRQNHRRVVVQAVDAPLRERSHPPFPTPFAGAPPPSSPTPTPRLQARRNNASTTNRLLARRGRRGRPGYQRRLVASTCPTLSDTCPPDAAESLAWVPSLCVATTSAFRASATAADAAQAPRPFVHPLAPPVVPKPLFALVLFVVEGRLGVARVADRAARNGSRTRTVISLCASALRSCAPRSSVWSSGFRVALIAADEAALGASASSRLLAFDNASSADTNRRGASRSMNARVWVSDDPTEPSRQLRHRRLLRSPSRRRVRGGEREDQTARARRQPPGVALGRRNGVI